jgi:hypothetical protein
MEFARIQRPAGYGNDKDDDDRPRRLRTLFGIVARDPLLHFLVFGGLLFLAAWTWQRLHDPHRIVLDRFTLDRIAVEYRQRFGAPPQPDALRAALAGYVEDEVLYREGVAQGVDRDDEIVRRRIIQKMRFLEEDGSAIPAPSDAVLRAFYAANRARYVAPEQVSFHHLYFSTDGGDALAYRRAEAVRAAIARDEPGAADRGDPFPDRSVFTDLSREGVERVFGESPFTDAVLKLPAGVWSAPLRSGMGWHLVHVDRKTIPAAQPFDAVRAQVAADWSDAQQAERNDQKLKTLAARYTIVMPDGRVVP